jgi:anti-sigma factor RsiW
MKEKVDGPGCGRENDLIAFLYGELDSRESTVFRSHMQECHGCAAELAEFSSIRESVVAWRNEALVGVTSPSFQASPVSRADVTKPGALAALREFFNLSPLWMKGAVVFASLLFCLFAGLAVARLRETPATPVAKNSGARTYSQEELNAAVEQRVQELQESLKPTPKSDVVVQRAADRVAPKRNTNSLIAAGNPQQKARRPLSKVERQQLAADLRLIDNPIDGDLDLLDDRINQ